MSKHDVCEACGGRVPKSALKCPHCGNTQLSARESAPAAPAEAPSEPARPPSNAARAVVGVVLVTVVILPCFGTLGSLVVGVLLAPSAPVSAVAVPEPQVVTSGGGGFAAIKARGKLRAAVDPDAPPFFGKAASGGYEGFEYALLSAIASQRGVEVELVERDFSALVPAVAAGEADLAIGQLTPGAQGVAWSVSYLQYELCLVVPSASPARSIPDLAAKRIGMYDDAVPARLVRAELGTNWTSTFYNDYGYFDDLVSGRIDGFVYDCPLATYELKPYAGKLKIVDDTLDVRTYAVAIAHGNPELKQDVDAVLRELGSAGLLQKLADQWLGTTPRDTYERAGKKRATVRPGETLADFAARTVGDAGRAKDVHAANEDVIGSDPTAIYAGMILRVP